MKKLIKWLSNVSGVEAEIRISERCRVGQELQDSAYWMTNIKRYGILYPLISQMANRLKGKYSIHSEFIRKKADEWLKHHESADLMKWYKDGTL